MSADLDRLNRIFECIVDAYVETAVPVGSRMVSKRYDENLSPASIRSVMADLEELGYLSHPHTSAGRVPTNKGYRYYVDTLMEERPKESEESPDVLSLMRLSSHIEDAVEKMIRQVADSTHQTTLVYLKKIRRQSFLETSEPSGHESARAQSVPDSRLYVDGTSHILDEPEFNDVDKVRSLMKALEVKDVLMNLLSEDADQGGLHIRIGDEMNCEALENVSLVTKEYSLHGVHVGCVTVMGPTRMRYNKAAIAVTQIADSLSAFLSDR